MMRPQNYILSHIFIGRRTILHSDTNSKNESVLKYGRPRHDILTIYCEVSTSNFTVISNKAQVTIHSSKLTLGFV